MLRHVLCAVVCSFAGVVLFCGCSGTNPVGSPSQGASPSAAAPVPAGNGALHITVFGDDGYVQAAYGVPTILLCLPLDQDKKTECDLVRPIGTTVTLTASPFPRSRSRSQFARWGGACESAGDNPVCVVKVTAEGASAVGRFGPV